MSWKRNVATYYDCMQFVPFLYGAVCNLKSIYDRLLKGPLKFLFNNRQLIELLLCISALQT